MKILCKILGHVWERLDDTEAGKGWWFENYKCKRCGARARTMVAGQEG